MREPNPACHRSRISAAPGIALSICHQPRALAGIAPFASHRSLALAAAGIALLACLGASSTAWAGDAPPLPSVDAAPIELHGVLQGQPFWAHLLAADAKFGGNRVLQLVYTPPAAEQLDGAHLSDTPFVLVDAHLRVVAWNGRDTGSQAVPMVQPAGYKVSRELLVGDGDARRPETVSRATPSELAWDLRIAPVLLAIAWHAGGNAAVPVVDLFGGRWQEHLAASWTNTAVTVAGQTWTVTASADGQLASLAAADGSTVLTITGRP